MLAFISNVTKEVIVLTKSSSTLKCFLEQFHYEINVDFIIIPSRKYSWGKQK